MKFEESDEDYNMKFKTLKSHWDAVKFEPKSQDELRRIMYVSALSRLTGFRTRPIKENLLFLGNLVLVFTVITVFEFFSDLSTAIFAVLIPLRLIDEYIGIRYLYFIKYQDTMEKSLQKILGRLKRLRLFSGLINALTWGSAILIVASSTTALTTVIIALLTLPLLVWLNKWTSKKWKDKAAEVKALLKDLVDDVPRGAMPVGF